MPINSRWQIPIDHCSLPTFLFDSPTASLPSKVAFYDADHPDALFLTQDSFRLWSMRLAMGLQKAGLHPGDRVLLFAGNSIFFPVVFMGIVMAGGVFTGANPGFVERELAYQLKDADVTFLICADEALELGIAAATSVGMSKNQVFKLDNLLFENEGKSRLGVRNLNALVVSEASVKGFRWYEPQDTKDAIVCLNYSSGTTGVPKGVMITHYACVANTKQFTHIYSLRDDDVEYTRKSKLLCFLPMYHAMAQNVFIAGALRRGLPVYIMAKFDFVKVLEAIQKYRITKLTLVPPIVVALAKSTLSRNYDLSSVEEISSGAAPLGIEISKEVLTLWQPGVMKLSQGWGMTEATCSMMGWDPRIEALDGSVGELLANCRAKITGVDGKEVGNGQHGELWVQGPSLMKGYWRNDKATREIFVDSPDGPWMRTGDIAYANEQNYFYIVDRLKELIKVKGNQVAPAELEGILLDHPQIADACVVGVTIQGEEVPRAFVVLKKGEKGNEKEVQKWLGERVSRHKRLTGGVAFIDSIPKNPSGKILRKILREKAKAEVGDGNTLQAKL